MTALTKRASKQQQGRSEKGTHKWAEGKEGRWEMAMIKTDYVQMWEYNNETYCEYLISNKKCLQLKVINDYLG